MDVPVFKLTAIQVLGVAAFGLVLGRWLKRLFPVLDRLSIPAAIIGGLVFALAHLAFRDRVVNFEFDMVLRDILMIAFFTTVGMAASLRLLKIGGQRVAIFLGASVVGLIAQIAWGMSAAKVMGLPPLLGIIPGAVSLTGGPATALAFGPVFEAAGVSGATAVGLASAVFGIVSSGLLGGFVGGFLVKRYGLVAVNRDGSGVSDLEEGASAGDYLTNIIVLSIAMALGSLVSARFQSMGWTLPAYIGAMICAGVIRNLDDWLRFARISTQAMDEIGNIALELFIVMALLTLRLWDLAGLALPVLVILLGQIVVTVALCWTLIFRLMGRDHEAAVTAGGYCGFMLGTTANAMACMNEIVQKTGPSPRAFFVVGIVGAFLIDFINAILITQALNLFR